MKSTNNTLTRFKDGGEKEKEKMEVLQASVILEDENAVPN